MRFHGTSNLAVFIKCSRAKGKLKDLIGLIYIKEESRMKIWIIKTPGYQITLSKPYAFRAPIRSIFSQKVYF